MNYKQMVKIIKDKLKKEPQYSDKEIIDLTNYMLSKHKSD